MWGGGGPGGQRKAEGRKYKITKADMNVLETDKS